jgi:hypothetical protein
MATKKTDRQEVEMKKTPRKAAPKPTTAKATTAAGARTKKPAVAKPAPKKPAPAAPTYQMIAQRAYEIWEAKGRPEGTEAENWTQAERELRGQG